MINGQKLISLRKAKKLSQKAVAEGIGISPRTYLRWEKDETQLTEKMVQKLSDFYGEDLTSLSDGDKKAAPKSVEIIVEVPTKANKKSAPSKASEKNTKSAPKKETKSATSKKATEPTINIELQYAGKAITHSEIIARAKEATGGKNNINIYVKPEENRVYYVSGNSVGSFEI